MYVEDGPEKVAKVLPLPFHCLPLLTNVSRHSVKRQSHGNAWRIQVSCHCLVLAPLLPSGSFRIGCLEGSIGIHYQAQPRFVPTQTRMYPPSHCHQHLGLTTHRQLLNIADGLRYLHSCNVMATRTSREYVVV